MLSTTFTWKTDPSAGPLPAHVYYADSSVQTKSRPVALIFHAGGFVLGSTNMIPKTQIKSLVTKGFVVVTPEYRLCPPVSLYDGPIQDAKDVLKWCQKELFALLEDQGITVDGKRVVSMGHSAGGMLALITGLSSTPPLAILDLYSPKYLSSPTYTQPLPIFSQIPSPSPSLIQTVPTGPQVHISEPMFIAGKPNLSDPRCAWYIQQIKQGTSISSIIPDGDYDRVDATSQFSKTFPPTYFLHGKGDTFVDWGVSVKAHEHLRELGVDSVLVSPEGVEHAFDLQIVEGDQEGEELFERLVEPALTWLAKWV